MTTAPEQPALTPAELAFVKRMAPHVAAGMSFDQAAAAVLQDDERLWLASVENSDSGAAIRESLGQQVYERLRRASG
jgi:O-glycosyl hydrolase